jgi:large subunit ribosomal protein L25
MESLKLISEYRASSGKGVSRRLRAQGRVPAVLYGHSDEPVKISIDEQDFRRVLRVQGETAIIGLSVEGEVKKDCDAIIKEIQQHPASGEILHVDFQHIRRDEKLKIEVPLVLLGEPLGVKEMGGVLEHGPRELVIRCFPRDIPERIEVDVSGLKMHDAIHVREIAARNPGFEFLDAPGTTLAIVVPSRIEEEAPKPAAAEEAAEPEVIGKGKEGEKKEDEAAASASDQTSGREGKRQ